MTRIDTEELHRLADNPDHTHLELTSEEVKRIATELDRFYGLQEEPSLPREADRAEEELAAWLDLVAERRHAERGEA